jgi:glycosyltransferase involved in cell wall biosynthesis
MKVLHVSTYDNRGGAARAANRLHQALLSIGVDSQMLVMQRDSDDPTVKRVPLGWPRLTTMLSQRADAWRLRWIKPGRPWHSNYMPNGIAGLINRLQPDIVQLHYVNGGFLPVRSIRHLAAPVVWRLDDEWAFTGGCHIVGTCRSFEQQCGHCPQLKRSSEHDQSRRQWLHKQRHWQDVAFTIVTPSRWLADLARASSLLRDHPITVIPNALNVNDFKPIADERTRTAVRRELGLSDEKPLVLFGAFNVMQDANKGGALLLDALRYLSRTHANDIQLVIFGTGSRAAFTGFDFPVTDLGFISDLPQLVRTYAMADVVVVPSKQEAFGQTASEALACGTPVVAFGATGLLDIVDHQQNGYLAQPYDPMDLAQGIEWVLADPVRHAQLRQNARERAYKQFRMEQVAERYLRLYQSINP